jgi:hypothetical protein
MTPGGLTAGAYRSGPPPERKLVAVSNLTVALITAVVVLSVVVWFDRRALADLASTSDYRLRYFNRNTWALIIVLSFPVGPLLYLMYGKDGP